MNFDKLFEAFEYGSFGAPDEIKTYVDKETGAYYLVAAHGDQLDDLPDDLGSYKYLILPGPNELDLGRSLVLRFAERFLPDDYGDVQDMFRRKGAYSAFKDRLARKGMLDQWYEYEAQAQRQALREWCEELGIDLEG
ncbi:hypothetical protein [Pseudomonas sp. RL]|jgi:hypothetical protein|uniref:hypothetical protein n=1 Tax=Pseudomonas sp. RL TaxID=1452718 RepID=UPI000562680A|nr:hypothetical protein [Pseudomonas sp. RL]